MKGRELKSFCGIEVNWFVSNRFYKVYLARDVMLWARLAGYVFDEESAKNSAQTAHFVEPYVLMYFRRLVRRREANELKYDEMDLATDRFLAEDSKNIRMPFRDLTKVEFVTKGHVGNYAWAGHSTQGYLNVTDMHGKRRRLYVTDAGEPRETEAMLREFIPSLEYRE
ncbi:MAG: hypothetical protein K1Y02_21215 [Candidatus Hydrogenedentes bacterium]|nr:hypothetical protein [Candidatus Hydrogenedentota bacterium]